jgi:two-component system cell cycle sensor histidine kinase/response regulator CckA
MSLQGPLVRVLVVDDQPIVLAAIARLLADAGFGVSVAKSAKEALAMLDHGDPAVHVVLTDVVMPELDGLTLGRLIGERHPRIPVLYMSVYSKDEVLPPAALGQAPPFIRKPFTSLALVAAIQSLLGKQCVPS